MKNSIVVILVCMLMMITVFSVVGATLTDNGDGTVTDDDRGDGVGLTWLQQPRATGSPWGMTWDVAMAWADNLVFAGKDDWRLPSAIDFQTGIPDTGWDSGDNEWGNLYRSEWHNPASESDIAPMTGYPWGYYWTSTENPEDSSQAYAFFASYDGMWINSEEPKSENLFVTAVRGSPPPDINLKPVASFTISDNFVIFGTPIELDPSPSYDPDGTIILYQWDLNGDGIPIEYTSASPVVVPFIYTQRQNYHVTLKVTDNSYQTDTETKTVFIIPQRIENLLARGVPVTWEEIVMACIMSGLIFIVIGYIVIKRWKKK